jgi:hypothetical protein
VGARIEMKENEEEKFGLSVLVCERTAQELEIIPSIGLRDELV